MRVAESVDVEDVEVGRREQDVLEELRGKREYVVREVVGGEGGGKRLTDVNMCQGSKNIMDAMR